MIYREDARVRITKKFEFESAHHLENYEGDCSRIHGHTYKLEVTVRGRLNELGMVIDFSELKTIVNTLIVEKFDHRLLNDVLPFQTTAENMAVFIYDTLAEFFKEEESGIEVMEVKLYETSDSFATYKGE